MSIPPEGKNLTTIFYFWCRIPLDLRIKATYDSNCPNSFVIRLGRPIKPTRRGTAASRITFHHIQTRVSNKRIKNVCPPRLAPRTLTAIPKAHRQFQLPTVLLSNTRALTNKVDEISGVMRNNNVDIAVITETWLTAAVPQQAADIAGYCAHHRMRDHNNEKSKGGGVAIYIREYTSKPP